MNHKKIFCFDSSKLLKICPDFKKYHYYDLAKDEKFLLGNAKITAECAIKLAKEEFNKTTFKDFKILICGFGRIGKYLTEFPHHKSMFSKTPRQAAYACSFH